MKILVTGANGYIGSMVTAELVALGVDVVATDLTASRLDPAIPFIEANLFDEKEDWYHYFGAPDVCLHLAWTNGFVHNAPSHMADLSGHYRFLTNLMEHGLPRLAVMGTMHEVGYWEGAVDENTPCKPLSLYGIAKNALRGAVEIKAKEHGCVFQWLRAYYMFGDDAFGASIFSKIRRAVKEGQATFPFTTGKNQYDFIHIDDLAHLISLTVMQDAVNGIINVCSGRPVSLAEQIEWYIRKNELPITLDYGKFPDRPYDSPCIYGDRSKLDIILASVPEEKRGGA